MKRIVLGKTGLEVNQLGFGGLPIQRLSEQQAVEIVLHAVQEGMDFIDTSRAYTDSERKIGLALQQTDKKVVLASKSHSRTSDSIRSDIEISLKELQTDYIDLYKCHFVNNDQLYEQVISAGGALEGLIKAKEEKMIGHIGISSHNLDLLERIIKDGLFEAVLVCFSFLEPAASDKIIPMAIDQDIGVITMKAFSGGVIENARLALKYALNQEGVVVIPGIQTKAEFDENWKIFQAGQKLDEEEKEEIKNIQQKHDKDFCRRCDYCLPCEEDIHIQLMLGIRSMFKRLGKGLLQRKKIMENVAKARECSECGECESRCPYELSIPELIKENLQWVDQQLESK